MVAPDPSRSQPIVAVDHVSKTFRTGAFKRGARALDGISLEVGPGTVFGLLGPNGAGKTTLVKILLGLVRGHEGQATLFGHPVGTAASRTSVGYLPEAHRLPQYLTGRQALLLNGMYSGRSKRWLQERIDGWLERVDMREHAGRKIREYSKGMQQRLGLAQAFIHEPKLVFLDEPTDGVDPVGRAAVRAIVADLKAQGVTIFINSHQLMEVEQVCDRAVIMQRGRILREGSVDELTPRTGAVHFALGQVPDNLEHLIGGVGAGFRAEEHGFQILLSETEQDEVIDRLRAAQVHIRSIVSRKLSLEESFIESVQGTSPIAKEEL